MSTIAATGTLEFDEFCIFLERLEGFSSQGDAYVVEEMVCRSLRRLPELGQTPERITALAGRA
eukprot:SAG11_NODE_1800_length_4243_cov_4.590734_8_plen_62_part_01